MIENPDEYQYYKIVITGNRSGFPDGVYNYCFTDLLLLAETTETEAVSYTVLYDYIDTTSFSGDEINGDSQTISKAFDHDTGTKVLFPKVTTDNPSRVMQWAMTQPVRLDAYALVTSNNMNGRDPFAWTLYASNDVGEAKTWTVLSDVDGYILPMAAKTQSDPIVIEAPGEYQYYKLEITDNRCHISKSDYQMYSFSELVLLTTENMGSAGGEEEEIPEEVPFEIETDSTDLHVLITSDLAYSQYIMVECDAVIDETNVHYDRTTNNVIVYYGEEPDGLSEDPFGEYINLQDKIDPSSITGDAGTTEDEGVDKLFDNDYYTKWCVETTIGEDGTRTVQWAMTEPVTLEAYALVTGNDMNVRDPWTWTLYGSDDPNGEWSVLAAVEESNLTLSRNTPSGAFEIENPGEYQYYKLVITDNRAHRNKTANRHYQASELILLACVHGDKTEVLAKAADCTNAGNNQYYICACGAVLKLDKVTETTVEAETIPALEIPETEGSAGESGGSAETEGSAGENGGSAETEGNTEESGGSANAGSSVGEGEAAADTGDHSAMYIWSVLVIISVLALAAVAFVKKREVR